MIIALFILNCVAMFWHVLGNWASNQGEEEAVRGCRGFTSLTMFASFVATIVYWCVT